MYKLVIASCLSTRPGKILIVFVLYKNHPLQTRILRIRIKSDSIRPIHLRYTRLNT